MKRVLTVSIVLMLLLTAAPAIAAKGGKPKPHGTFNVTLTGVLDTASCGVIPMTGTVPGTLRADLSTDVGVGLDLPVGWDRSYDAGWGLAGQSLNGCHGISHSASDTDSFGGYLIIDIDAAGAVTDVSMRFDYYWQFGVNPRNGRPAQQALEMFGLTAVNLVDGTGVFSVTLFTKEGKDIVNDWIPVGSADGALTATITPAG